MSNIAAAKRVVVFFMAPDLRLEGQAFGLPQSFWKAVDKLESLSYLESGGRIISCKLANCEGELA
jgi:hypothetical protein